MSTPLEPPRWLDHEPDVLWGCTQPELAAMLGAALTFAVPVSVLAALSARVGGVSLALLAVPLCAVLVYVLLRTMAAWVRQAKRGRPAGYYRLRWHRALAGAGLARSRYIEHDGYWRLGRR